MQLIIDKTAYRNKVAQRQICYFYSSFFFGGYNAFLQVCVLVVGQGTSVLSFLRPLKQTGMWLSVWIICT